MSEGNGYTVKEIVEDIRTGMTRLEGKIDGYMAAHETRHAADMATDITARSDPSASPAGRTILGEIKDVKAIQKTDHDLLMKVRGIGLVLDFIGFGGIVALGAKVFGIVP